MYLAYLNARGCEKKKRVSIQSGELLSVGYNNELQVLEVEFIDHSVYQLVKVSAEVYAALMNAPDKYEYFIANIDTKYLGQKV